MAVPVEVALVRASAVGDHGLAQLLHLLALEQFDLHEIFTALLGAVMAAIAINWATVSIPSIGASRAKFFTAGNTTLQILAHLE